MTKPSVGRIVHYQTYGTPGGEHLPEPVAAIVTEVPELLPEQPNSGPPGYVPAVHLCVLYPNGLSFKTNVHHADMGVPQPGRWNWPPREPSVESAG